MPWLDGSAFFYFHFVLVMNLLLSFSQRHSDITFHEMLNHCIIDEEILFEKVRDLVLLVVRITVLKR